MPPEVSEKPTPDLNATAQTPWQLMKRRKAGEALTDAERAVLAAQDRKYAPCRRGIYIPAVQLEVFDRLAHEQGMTLGPWLVHRANLSLMDKSPQEQLLEDEIVRVTAERDNLRLQVGQLATENAENTRKAQNLVDELRDLAQRLAKAREARERGEETDEGADA
ncbi:MAG TPA: hypothetical protein VM286_08640 [Candidatus Thermoplasmatota archaeon]|nr:hypothetical protein [Candidatus Thermoplasmatota archaeon]